MTNNVLGGGVGGGGGGGGRGHAHSKLQQTKIQTCTLMSYRICKLV